MSRHYFGKRINGELCRFHQCFDSDEFERITQNGMPPDWVAWHFEDREHAINSERVRILRERPLIADNFGDLVPVPIPEHGPIESSLPLADAERVFARESASAGIEPWIDGSK